MKQAVTNLIKATEDLLEFIDDNSVHDEMANDGDGYINTWKSGEFHSVINSTQEKLDELKEVQNDTKS